MIIQSSPEMACRRCLDDTGHLRLRPADQVATAFDLSTESVSGYLGRVASRLAAC
jgi:hypothetical protein